MHLAYARRAEDAEPLDAEGWRTLVRRFRLERANFGLDVVVLELTDLAEFASCCGVLLHCLSFDLWLLRSLVLAPRLDLAEDDVSFCGVSWPGPFVGCGC
jgi:hypothetical protein